jgi:hypothetical protein
METAVEVDKASRGEKSKKRKPNEQQKSTSSGRNFTSVQMFHTHTHLDNKVYKSAPLTFSFLQVKKKPVSSNLSHHLFCLMGKEHILIC